MACDLLFCISIEKIKEKKICFLIKNKSNSSSQDYVEVVIGVIILVSSQFKKKYVFFFLFNLFISL